MPRPRETSPAIPASLGRREVMQRDVLARAVEGIDLEEMLAQMSGRLDTRGQNTFVEQQTAARQQVAALAAEFASSERFRPLFEWLLDITVRRPVSIWGLGDDRCEYVDRREGANSVIWQLLQAVAEGRGEVPPPMEGTPT